MGSTVIMGRRTWQSIGSKPLPGRHNIVITRNLLSGVDSYINLSEALASCEGDIWFIGGAKLYAAALNYCDFIDVMWVPDEVTGDDLVYFPELPPSDWRAGSKTPLAEDNRLISQRFYRR